MTRRFFFAAFLTLFTAFPAYAQRNDQPNNRQPLPPQLKGWEGWVAADLPDLHCPELNEQRICAWPGTLRVEVDTTGASFTLAGFVDRDTSMPLPGGKGIWPQNVSVNGAKALISKKNGAPTAIVKRGEVRIEGRFRWTKIPDVLPIPKEVGRTELNVSSKPVPFPRIDTQGRLFLKEGAASTALKKNRHNPRYNV